MRTYQQYDYAKEMRRAWEALGEYLGKLDSTLAQIAAPDAGVSANDDMTDPPRIDVA